MYRLGRQVAGRSRATCPLTATRADADTGRHFLIFGWAGFATLEAVAACGENDRGSRGAVLEFNVQVTGKIFGLRAGDPSGYSRPRAVMRGKIFSVSLHLLCGRRRENWGVPAAPLGSLTLNAFQQAPP